MRPILDPCADWRALASAELDGELDELDRARLQLHLAGCIDCTGWLREAAVVQSMLVASEVDLSEPIVGRLRRVRARVVTAAVASGAAAALAVVAIGIPGANKPSGPAVTPPSISAARLAAATSATCSWCLDRQAVVTMLEGQAPQVSIRGPILT